VLEGVAACGGVRRVFLNTQDEGALKLYERHGFAVLAADAVEPPGGGAPFTSWAMALDTPRGEQRQQQGQERQQLAEVGGRASAL
jgi:hypothetical protein